MRIWNLALIFFFVTVTLLSLPRSAVAAPTVTSTWVMTQYHGPNNIPNGPSEEWIFDIGCYVDSEDPIESVWAYGQPNFELTEQYHGTLFDYYYGWGTTYAGQEGAWNVVATDVNQVSGNAMTHDLDQPRQLPLATGITFSDSSPTPTINWDRVYYDHDRNPGTPDEEVDKYRVRLMRAWDDQFWQSSWLDDPTLTIPAGVIQPGESIFVRIQAADFEDFPLRIEENRSNTYVDFTASDAPGRGDHDAWESFVSKLSLMRHWFSNRRN